MISIEQSKMEVHKVNTDVVESTNPKVVAIFSYDVTQQAIASILFSLALKREGKRVYLNNLEDHVIFPLIAPYDKQPDFLVLNSPVNCLKSRLATLECATSKILFAKTESEVSFLTQAPLQTKCRMHFASIDSPNQTHEEKLFKAIKCKLEPQFKLNYLGNLNNNQNVSKLINSGYQLTLVDPAVAQYLSIAQKFIVASSSPS
ncbi:hypothetical protein [Flocculibacter collagenilyticus]|uniref:hypothetical protein n=1 Tax=Flocculibacter collagenilyticus TaxID=2744479 RepID=UPI0018F6C709|nr:hypothetical protein [Flocculibacter collagenilyticus]